MSVIYRYPLEIEEVITKNARDLIIQELDNG